MKDHVFPVFHDDAATEWMPPRHPLEMPTQDFSHPFTDGHAPQSPTQRFIWLKRAAVFFPALTLTVLLTMVFADTLPGGGNSAINLAWIVTVSVTFFWISFVLCLSAAGLIASWPAKRPTPKPMITPPLDVAILMPVYNEDVSEVFSNLLAIQADLAATTNPHRFCAFVLSDSQDPKIIAQERRVFEHLRAPHDLRGQLFYRRRETNRDFKTGNLRQWVSNWGGAYDAMLVLDADSLMSAEAVLELTNTLARNPSLGIVQGALRIFRGRNLMARWQQFTGIAFGALHARGLALWSGDDGNFFGHNAILRTRAFAACSGLPAMVERANKHIPILSHDFVEAALLRRAGWGVRILPDLSDSYEGTPETLIDFIRRDRRWCQGNMQHLRIMTTAGLHPMSRHHMFHNALTYLMSPAWLILILLWTVHSVTASGGTSQANFAIFAVIYAMLLAPKIASAAVILSSKSKRRTFGGSRNFLRSFLNEMGISILVAPIMMIHQSIGVCRSVFRLSPTWGTPVRQGEKHSPKVLLRFHAVETVFGGVLIAGTIFGGFSAWLIPIAFSLFIAPVISRFSRMGLSIQNSAAWLMQTELDQSTPKILSDADSLRVQLVRLLETPSVCVSQPGAGVSFVLAKQIKKSA